MENQTDSRLLNRALDLFTPDVFKHPVWIRFGAASPVEFPEHILQLLSEAKQMQAERDIIGACSVLFLCASRQAVYDDYRSALECINRVLKLSKQYHLPQAALWGLWGAGAICAQMGALDQSAEYLLRLQQSLYEKNDWVMADLIELVRQSLLDCANRVSQGLIQNQSSLDRSQLLIEQLLCWGKPEIDAIAVTGSAPLSTSPIGKFKNDLRESGWRSFLNTLQRFFHGESGHLLTEDRIKTLDTVPAVNSNEITATPADPSPSSPELADPPIQVSENPSEESAPTISFPLTIPEVCPSPLLNAYLLGSFRVTMGNALIENWPNGRSRGVFAYLLAHHDHPVQREVVMETFWPETSLASARNNLNVTIHTLRQTLKNIMDFPVILLHDGAYQINPDLRLWIDVESFEQYVHDGLQHGSSGGVDEAICEYQMAINLYQGDFLADTPYENWMTLQRERLRVLYLDTLDHLSMIYFSQNSYDACIGLCQRILNYDGCREDAHCRLMRCYARQGQIHLALRQYQACVDALREELDVPPSPATVQLGKQIKRQEGV